MTDEQTASEAVPSFTHGGIVPFIHGGIVGEVRRRRTGPLDTTVSRLTAERDALRAELRRLQRIIIDSSETTDCEDLCMVLCAGPCQGEILPTQEDKP